MTYAEWKKIRRIAKRNGFDVPDTPAHENGQTVPLVIRFTLDAPKGKDK